MRDPTRARRYMERYVNDGSPSGFTQKYTSSLHTSPFGSKPSFTLWATQLPASSIEDLGELPSWIRPGEILLHPDMACEEVITANSSPIGDTALQVVPTASARTVESLDPAHPGFLKLNYKGLLGRVNRQISRSHALSALDVLAVLNRATEQRSLPACFAYLRESGARVALLNADAGAPYEWGTVFRGWPPYPLHANTAYIIPVFSLFASDRNKPSDPPLLRQLIDCKGDSAEEYVFWNVIEPIMTCYFELLLTCSLQFECNAQNVLLGFDDDGTHTSVIFRDFESVDKDLSLVEDLKLDIAFASSFKCVHRELYNYSIKHSFMYDFKLGEYVLSPIIGASIANEITQTRLTARAKELGRKYVERFPPAFFPADGQWYSYENVVVDKSARRPYVGKPHPKYR